MNNKPRFFVHGVTAEAMTAVASGKTTSEVAAEIAIK